MPCSQVTSAGGQSPPPPSPRWGRGCPRCQVHACSVTTAARDPVLCTYGGTPLQNAPLRHRNYFELKATDKKINKQTKTKQIQEKLSILPLFA